MRASGASAPRTPARRAGPRGSAPCFEGAHTMRGISVNQAVYSLCALGLAACFVPMEDEPIADLATSETESSLLVSNWSSPANISATTIWYGQVATISGRTFMVHSGSG